MPKLGLFPYINGADSKAITDTLVLDAVPGSSHEIQVMYNNESNKDVLVEKDTVTVRLVDIDNGTVVRTATEASGKFLAAKLSTELGKIDLNGTPALVAGTNYEVRAYLNGEQLDEVAKIYVKSDESDAEKVTVQGVEVDLTAGTLEVKLPVGTNLDELKASDVVVTTKHAKATVGDITITDSGSDKQVDFKITAENGTDESTYSITVKVAVAPSASTTTANFIISTPADVALQFELGDGESVTEVRLGDTVLRAAEYVTDLTTPSSSTVTIAKEALEQYVTDNSLEVGDTITATVEFEIGGSIEYTITLE